ncbi:hypothetical protein J5226_22180 [Lysobacter sp. K5869]|uniref:hypothetical protein n=1 Tax=Lysobacter sp. K5869 TaxID=2820808 RepID=UPI001C0639F6|nr:hypothetical protein [Lysobacter sp. K5869]QWP76265.1 hypothetical protein J5226_22180 [Lysobacter sp. K5869]
MRKIEEFFARYERGANTFDPDQVAAQFTAQFMGADPNGVACIGNDATFREAIDERRAFFGEIGFRSARVLGIEPTALDERYTLAKVRWRMAFDPPRPTPDAPPRVFEFDISYVLFDPGDGPKVAFYVSHEDERRTMREGGLID